MRQPDRGVAKQIICGRVRVENDRLQRIPVFVQVDGRHIGIEPIAEPQSEQQAGNAIDGDFAKRQPDENSASEISDDRAQRRPDQVCIDVVRCG